MTMDVCGPPAPEAGTARKPPAPACGGTAPLPVLNAVTWGAGRSGVPSFPHLHLRLGAVSHREPHVR